MSDQTTTTVWIVFNGLTHEFEDVLSVHTSERKACAAASKELDRLIELNYMPYNLTEDDDYTFKKNIDGWFIRYEEFEVS